LFIEQIMVIGEGQKMPAALIQPNFDYIKNWFSQNGIAAEDDLVSICKNQSLLDEIQKEIDDHNQRFGKWEQIKKFELTPEMWSIENEFLTPTMKVKRNTLKTHYKDLITKIYQ
ncbi:MAG: long-chain fatty acid--CoA ligase, partial [Flavobacteriales bacterium]